MEYDYESIDTKGTRYGYVDKGHIIMVYADNDKTKASKNDKFLRTILKDIKDLRELKDIESIKNTIKERNIRYNIK